jgi:hypothetical protein
MATKSKTVAKKSPGTAVSLVREDTKAIAPVADWRQVAAESVKESAKSLAAMPAGGGNWLSFKDTGRFAIGSEDRGNTLDVVIVAHATEHSYFANPYVEGVKATADCYSLDTERPHPDAKDKQHDDCATCPHMQMGSDERRRGRACKVKGRIAFIMADQLTDVDSILSAALFFATPSTLNSIPLRTYLTANDRAESPIFSKRTTLGITAGGKAKYALTFQRTGTIENEEALRALAARNIEARAEMKKARPVMENEEAAAKRDDRKPATRKRKF